MLGWGVCWSSCAVILWVVLHWGHCLADVALTLWLCAVLTLAAGGVTVLTEWLLTLLTQGLHGCEEWGGGGEGDGWQAQKESADVCKKPSRGVVALHCKSASNLFRDKNNACIPTLLTQRLHGSGRGGVDSRDLCGCGCMGRRGGGGGESAAVCKKPLGTLLCCNAAEQEGPC